MDELPPDVVDRRPVLAVGFVGALMAGNEFDGIERRLGDVELVLARPADEIEVVDHDELPRLPGAIETYRAALALVAGDTSATARHAHLALDRAVADDHLTRSAASALAGLASWSVGDLATAHHRYAEAAAGLERAGHLADVLGCSITLADLEITLGRLDDARHTYEQALALATDGPEGLRGVADMYVGLSRLACERNDLAEAADYLRRSDALGDRAGLPQNPYRWRVAMARIREAEGDRVAALSLLDEALRVYVADFAPDVRPIEALRVRLWAAQGELGSAQSWVRRRGLSPDDDLSYAREYEHLTLARVLLADHAVNGAEPALAEALRLLERILAAAEEGGRVGTVIEILLLQALALHAAGTPDGPSAALEALTRALTLAEPEGYVRVVVGEGRPMVDLLRRLDRRRPGWGYLGRLLDAATTTLRPTVGADPGPGRACPRRAAERPGTRRPAVARLGPRRARDRPRARGLPQHGAHPHQEHLRQARRQQPPRRRTPGPPAQAAHRPAPGSPVDHHHDHHTM